MEGVSYRGFAENPQGGDREGRGSPIRLPLAQETSERAIVSAGPGEPLILFSPLSFFFSHFL